MNRYREELPYVFSPPKYSRFWAPLIYALSDRLYLRRRHRVCEVVVRRGMEALLTAQRDGSSILVAPNHSDHADPHMMLHLGRRYRIPLHFIAAREIFLVNHGVNGRILQRAGVFSIDREGSDLRAIKEAMRIVGEAQFPLVMFPEGEIYHLNEQLTPLNEGAATIMLRTAKRMRKDGRGRNVVIVPVAIRYTYVDDIAPLFADALARLEARILWKPQSHLDIVDRIYKFGEAVLALKEKEYVGQALDGSIPERLVKLREFLIGEVEGHQAATSGTGSHPERIRRLRGRIRTVMLADNTPDDATRAQCFRDLDALHVAIQLYSYPAQYLRDRPSTDRVAETILKFEEDFFGETQPKGQRRAEVTICDPIPVNDYLDAYAGDPKTTCRQVTERMAAEIQTVLEG